jgi:hypothetical protein
MMAKQSTCTKNELVLSAMRKIARARNEIHTNNKCDGRVRGARLPTRHRGVEGCNLKRLVTSFAKSEIFLLKSRNRSWSQGCRPSALG